MVVKHLHEEGSLAREFAQAGDKLVLVDFFATWCGPCKTVAPQLDKLSNQYPNVVFVKIDVEEMADTARHYNIRAMPTFIFFKNCQSVAQVQGGNVAQIEANIKQFATGGIEVGGTDKDGMFDLVAAIDKSKSECLNEADDHAFSCLFQEAGYLESDCDEQLIIHIAFNQPVKLHSLKFKSRENGPKTVKIFTNLPRTLDFDQADGMEPLQELILTAADVTGDEPVPLKFVKFQNVQNLQLFIKDNQSGTEVTRLDQLGLHGIPISATNMGDFKRITGNSGERDFNGKDNLPSDSKPSGL